MPAHPAEPRGRRARAALLASFALVASIGGAVVVAPTPPAAAATPSPLARGWTATFTSPGAKVPTGAKVLAGHFGADAPDDVLFVGNGAVVWRGAADLSFTSTSITSTSQSLQPVVGDFTGDRVDDVFFYGPGSAAEKLWKGTASGGFTSGPTRAVSGTYRPVAGDFTGDGIDDIFWYAPGTAPEAFWRGGSGGSFTSLATSAISRDMKPVVGDFTGDGHDDIYWYAPGSPAEVLWRGGSAGTFSSATTKAVSGTYQPVPGDFDGNGRTDIYWYAPGAGAESLFLSGPPGATFTVASGVPTVGGTYAPAAADLNGDACTDIAWYSSSAASTALYMGTSAGRGCHPPVVSCPTLPGLDRWDWVGPPNGAWGDAGNWKPAAHTVDVGYAQIPGQRLDTQSDDDYVCIPATGSPRLVGAGKSANILVLENLGSLVIAGGAKLELKGTAPSAAVYASHSHDLTIGEPAASASGSEATLFGEADLVVTSGGSLTLGDSGNGTPTLSTRDGDLESLEGALPVGRSPLTVTIAGGATFDLSGEGINLWDHTHVWNYGTTSLLGPTTYVAADYGTAFDNVGTFQITADGDYVQGFDRSLPSLGTFTNAGLVRKAGGSQVSVFDTDWSQPAGGSVQVVSGQVSLFTDGTVVDPPPVSAQVDAGATLRTGGCNGSPSQCTGQQQSQDQPQYASLTRPVGASSTPVTIDLAPPNGLETGTIGKVVALTAAATATPMTFRITVDAATAAGRDKTTMDLKHDGNLVADCPVANPALDPCIDRAASTGSVGQPVTLVIQAPKNGRWRFV